VTGRLAQRYLLTLSGGLVEADPSICIAVACPELPHSQSRRMRLQLLLERHLNAMAMVCDAVS
jgi:hypothetical protein